jgi:hypothetical protein
MIGVIRMIGLGILRTIRIIGIIRIIRIILIRTIRVIIVGTVIPILAPHRIMGHHIMGLTTINPSSIS